MGNDFVAMAQKICRVTGKKYESGELLIDKRLKPIKEEKTIMGWGFSPEVQEKIDNDFIAMVEIDYEKSKNSSGKITPQSAYRLGGVCYLKRVVFLEIFNISEEDLEVMVFVEPDVVEFLKKLNKE